MSYSILHQISDLEEDQLDEMAKPIKICDKCGKQITGNHYWYKGGWKCRSKLPPAPAPEQQQQPTADSQPQQQATISPPVEPRQFYEIESSMLPVVQAEIDKLNNRSQKIGLPPITITVIGDFPKTFEKADFLGKLVKTTRRYFKITIQGAAPRLVDGNGNHWELVASLEHTPHGTIINVVPGKDVANLQQFYTANPDRCDHCGKVRRRVGTFIVINSSGQMMQVGRQCLKDFLGHKSPQAIVSYLELFNSLDSWLENLASQADTNSDGRGSGEGEVPVDDILRWTVGLVDNYGFTSAKAAEETSSLSTASYVRKFEFGASLTDPQDQRIYNTVQQYIETERAIIDRIIAQIKRWVMNITPEEVANTPYYHNLQVLVQNQFIKSKNIGYASSMYTAWKKAIQRAESDMEEKQQKQQESNEYLGQIGDKIQFVGTVKSDTNIEGIYGMIQLLRFNDETGNSVVWFNNGRRVDVTIGNTYNIRGTVKKQEEYKGKKQTSISHVKVTDNDTESRTGTE